MSNEVALVNHAERAHAELGGSSAHRWTNCSGSILLSRSVPAGTPSEAALEGTRLHQISEQALTQLITYFREGLKIHDSIYDHEENYISEVLQLVYENVFLKQITGKVIGLEKTFIVDSRFNMSGTADVWGVYIDTHGKRAGFIVDFKFGHHPVEAEKNAQLAFYSDGLLQFVREKGKDLDYVRAIIIQPKTDPAYKETKFTIKQLEAWHKKFLDAAHKVYVQKKFNYKVGEWCHFCPGKVLCKAYLNQTKKETDLDLVNLNEVIFENPETLSKEVVENIVLHADKLEDFIKRCREYIINQLRSGYESAHLKIVEGQSRRRWIEDDKEVSAHLQQLGLKIKEIYTAELRNIGDIEKQLVKLEKPKYKGKKANEVKGIVKDLLTNVTEKGKGNVSLVPITDERPAINNALNLFSNENLDT